MSQAAAHIEVAGDTLLLAKAFLDDARAPLGLSRGRLVVPRCSLDAGRASLGAGRDTLGVRRGSLGSARDPHDAPSGAVLLSSVHPGSRRGRRGLRGGPPEPRSDRRFPARLEESPANAGPRTPRGALGLHRARLAPASETRFTRSGRSGARSEPRKARSGTVRQSGVPLGASRCATPTPPGRRTKPSGAPSRPGRPLVYRRGPLPTPRGPLPGSERPPSIPSGPLATPRARLAPPIAALPAPRVSLVAPEGPLVTRRGRLVTTRARPRRPSGPVPAPSGLLHVIGEAT
jgi:hypothetical protein